MQSTFVKSGRYRFTVGDESFEVGPGDAFVVPSGVTHGCKLLEGRLLDTFTPAGTISSDADRRDPPRHRPATARASTPTRCASTSTLGGIFVPGEIRLIYTHYDRMIVGGAVPDGAR